MEQCQNESILGMMVDVAQTLMFNGDVLLWFFEVITRTLIYLSSLISPEKSLKHFLLCYNMKKSMRQVDMYLTRSIVTGGHLSPWNA